MIKKQLLVFLLRCIASSLGIWLCVTWFGNIDAIIYNCPKDTFCIEQGGLFNPLLSSSAWIYYLVAGLIFSLFNSIVKPLVKLMVLPLAIVTMGLSTVLINIGMIFLTVHILPGVEMEFWGFVASSAIMSLINSLVNLLMPSYNYT